MARLRGRTRFPFRAMNSALSPVSAMTALMQPSTLGRWLMRSQSGPQAPTMKERVTWHAPTELPEAPGPAEVLPSLPSKRLKIVCLPGGVADQLSRKVRATCDEQAQLGLKLSSTFCHDRSIFLVFKRL